MPAASKIIILKFCVYFALNASEIIVLTESFEENNNVAYLAIIVCVRFIFII